MYSLFKTLPALAALLLSTLLALPATAATPLLRCGQYVNAAGGAVIAIDTATRGRRLSDGLDVEPLVVDTVGDSIVLVNLEYGVPVPLTVSADGRSFNDTQQDFRLHRAAACKGEAPAPAGHCRADAAQCVARLHAAAPPQLLQTCLEGVGAACSALLQAYEDDALVAVVTARGAMPDERAAAPCTADADREDVLTCRDARRDALAAALARAQGLPFARGIDPAEVALPDGQREQLQQLCMQQRSGRFCTQVAAQQLTARDLPAALQALQVVCAGGRLSACERVEPLQALGQALRLVDATAAPCGRYQADGGSLDTITFGDAGRARIDTQDAQVVLLDGAIHLRHDGGGDHVLGLLANGDLIGLDAWTGYQRYQRQPGTMRCAADEGPRPALR